VHVMKSALGLFRDGCGCHVSYSYIPVVKSVGYYSKEVVRYRSQSQICPPQIM